MTLVDLRPRLADPVVGALLADAIGDPTPVRLARVLDSYRHDATDRLLGWFDGEVLLGCVGLEHAAPGLGIVRHIAVAPSARRRGVGRAMLDAVGRMYGLHELRAETDVESVDFYRRCGFQVTSLGERYPGVERFQCVRRMEG